MNITEILSLKDISRQTTLLKTRPSSMPAPNVATLRSQFNPTEHRVFDQAYRPKKEVRKSGEDITLVDVARIAFPFQKTIVKRASSFLFGSDVTLDYDTEGDASMEKVAEMLKKIIRSTKAGNINKELSRRLFSEMEVAEYWYPVMDEKYWGSISKAKFKLRCKLFSPFLGDVLYPHYDQHGDLDAFSRSYYLAEISDSGAEVKTEYLDCFTRDGTIRFKKETNGWSRVKFITTDPQTGTETEVDMAPNYAGRIPVVYYYQDQVDWEDVQPLIERFEDSISNFADTNDYFGRPILTIDGSIISLPDKGESGKVVQLEKDAKAAYLTWDQAPESIKLELNTLEEGIYSNSQTPNISFEKIKGLTNPSGIALKLMFIDAHLKALDKIEIFGTGLQRRYNIIKGFIGALDTALKDAAEQLDVEPVITPYLPSNEQDLINFVTTATAGKAVMSRKTAIRIAGQVADIDQELQDIQQDETSESANPTI